MRGGQREGGVWGADEGGGRRWAQQEALSAARAAWCVRALAFRHRAAVAELGLAELCRLAVRVAAADDAATDAAGARAVRCAGCRGGVVCAVFVSDAGCVCVCARRHVGGSCDGGLRRMPAERAGGCKGRGRV